MFYPHHDSSSCLPCSCRWEGKSQPCCWSDLFLFVSWGQQGQSGADLSPLQAPHPLLVGRLVGAAQRLLWFGILQPHTYHLPFYARAGARSRTCPEPSGHFHTSWGVLHGVWGQFPGEGSLLGWDPASQASCLPRGSKCCLHHALTWLVLSPVSQAVVGIDAGGRWGGERPGQGRGRCSRRGRGLWRSFCWCLDYVWLCRW